MMKDDSNGAGMPPPDYPGSMSNGGGGPPHAAPRSHHGGAASSIGPPPSQHTSVTMTTGPGHITQIELDIGYFKTLPGIVKLVQLILGIVCMALGSPAREFIQSNLANYGTGHNHWFLFVVVTSFLITLLWAFFYLLKLKDSINMQLPFDWGKVEYYYTVAATIFYALAFIVLLAGFGFCSGNARCDTRIAAGVFGLFNTFAYAAGAYILHNSPPDQQ